MNLDELNVLLETLGIMDADGGKELKTPDEKENFTDYEGDQELEMIDATEDGDFEDDDDDDDGSMTGEVPKEAKDNDLTDGLVKEGSIASRFFFSRFDDEEADLDY